jgi:phosphoribosylanthranilate isomerase
MKIKICGMREAKNIEAVAALHPHYMGFIFYPPSPRFVGDDFVLPSAIDKTILKVGVFVNASADEILKSAEKYKLDIIQLHGTESPADCQAIRNRGYQVIKAFAINEHFDFSSTAEYAEVCDYFLFDTNGKHYGGNAQTFNWELLQKYTGDKPYFLSGGLAIDNFKDALALNDARLHALDFNSGLEFSPGLKDLKKVEEVIHQLTLTP